MLAGPSRQKIMKKLGWVSFKEKMAFRGREICLPHMMRSLHKDAESIWSSMVAPRRTQPQKRGCLRT